jgi:hypothetical protein
MFLHIVCQGCITLIVVQEWLAFAILGFFIGYRLTTLVQFNKPLGFFNMVIFQEEYMSD